MSRPVAPHDGPTADDNDHDQDYEYQNHGHCFAPSPVRVLRQVGADENARGGHPDED